MGGEQHLEKPIAEVAYTTAWVVGETTDRRDYIGMPRFLVRTFLVGVGLVVCASLLLVWAVYQEQRSRRSREEYAQPESSEIIDGIRRGPYDQQGPESDAINSSRAAIAQQSEVKPYSYCNNRIIEPRLANQKWTETHLIFYGKPIMQAVKSICIQREWKVKLILDDSESGLVQLEKTLSPHVFTIAVVPSRALRHPLIRKLANSTNSLVAAVRYTYKITGAKKAQLQAFRKHFDSYGCSLEDIGILPRSFLLDDPVDCVQFFKYASSHTSSWWVLKASQGYGGNGITILSNLTSAYRDFGACRNKEEFIMQEYLSDLLLVEGRKFDVRALVLIAGTDPYLLFHHNGYLRVSVKEFDLKNEADKAVHLTNSHVQAFSEGFRPEKHYWSYPQFQGYLDERYPENGGFVINRLVPFIKKISAMILNIGLKVFSRMPSTFQLLGLDFMVTRDFRVWFIEANNYPLWPKGTPYINELINTLGNDMFDLVFDLHKDPGKFLSMKPGEWYGSWELVWNEAHAVCSGDPPYDPCKEFTP